MKERTIRLLRIILVLTVLHIMRIALKFFIFRMIPQTIILNNLISGGYMLIMSVLMYHLAARRQRWPLFPEKWNAGCYLISALVLIIFLSTLFFINEPTILEQTSLIYGAVVTPLFEELLFRGYVWSELKGFNHGLIIVINAVLFGLWHLGYVDTVIWRLNFFAVSGNLLQIMFFKMLTGMLIGLVLAGLRSRYQNVYIVFLFHCLINIIGS
ncbi:hypothetical protein SDC9_112386 [bioreactor metagenome]|uniref:CAAX prenyl protease 2/Lysostaphin resistance protein A-like domain-containing protein n=1 Tax=bioreactor metagenome TaxID=1076179 RepID=A0A645BJ44_9ZZZZ